ncbi:DMT family transporter [Qiania dongpingensis]|uniref:DMT family transporter n=1 Tax=Qiania dongpingensis TaxID=2763669 RepID=A0A7G9G1A8_9FIRM|nr:DMT family transporter [Qiania dongpingensis]QNM04590.1 DMT family transporter [Qiania dongpingensis]
MRGYIIGELCSLGVALCDAVTCTCFNTAGKKINTFTVNFLKTVTALVCVAVIRMVMYGTVSLAGVSLRAWFYLSLSGLIGFVFGDFFYFSSFRYLPYRISMMIFYSSPIVTSLAAWGLYGQMLQPVDWAGVLLITLGLCIVLLARSRQADGAGQRKQTALGAAFAVLGMFGQAGGVLLSSRGLRLIETADGSLAASQVRIIAGVVGFFVVILVGKRGAVTSRVLKYPKELGLVMIGGVCGCAAGTTLTLHSLNYIPAGISSAITSVSPVMILLFTALVLREKIRPAEIIGAVVCISGIVALSV